jgi:hypothetical protein
MDIELLLKLMNEYGCTHLKSKEFELTVPEPRRSLTQTIMTISKKDQDAIKKVVPEPTQKPLSAQALDDEILFWHEKLDLEE